MMDFRINNTSYKVKELSIDKFTEFSNKLSELKDFAEMTRLVLTYYTDIPDYLIKVIGEESLAIVPVDKIIVSDKIKIDFDFNDIKVGQFIDIEEFLKLKKYQYAVAVMRSNKDYTLKEIETTPTYTSTEAMSYLAAYNDWKINLFKQYDDIITKADTKKKIKENEDKGNTWLELVHSLADYDATNVKQELIYKRTLISLLMTLRLKKNATKNN